MKEAKMLRGSLAVSKEKAGTAREGECKVQHKCVI